MMGLVFIKSGRGLIQGDPLFPSLFVLTAELLAMMLNALHDNPRYQSFYMCNQNPNINHLSFADDILSFY